MSSYFPQSTFFGLDLMSTSLQSFSVAENVTSDNISNVNTPGASRQQVDFNEATPLVGSPFMATHVPGTVGQGAVISEIQRIHDNAYDAMFRGASSSQNYYSTEQTVLQGIQSQLGDPNAGIGTQYANFQSAIAQLTSQAGSTNSTTAARQNVLQAAQSLANSLGSASNAITTQEQSVLQQGATLVKTVNGILDQIGALNGQIRASTAVGDSPNTFADQRDYLIDQLSQYLGTQTSIQSDGSTLVSVNGQALVNDTQVYHLAAPVVGQASNGAPTFKINFDTSPPAAANAPGIPLGSGQLAALQDVYNNKLASYGTQLDQFASSMANEVNRITESAYDQNGNPGTALFQPIVASLPISAGNIKCGITDPNQLPVALANTSAGTLVVPLNSANNKVDTSQPIDGNTSLANPPAADAAGPPVTGGTYGALTINVDGVSETFNYNTNALQTSPPAPVAANATSINAFIQNFNAGHFGVTASFDASSQRIVFARDPQNEDLALRGAQQNNPQTAAFTITDAPASGAGILSALGANGINGVAQNASNAFAASDNGAANALTKMFSSNVGIPAVTTTSAAAAIAGTPMTVVLPPGVTNVQVGQVLTIDDPVNPAPLAGTTTENVTVSAISFNPVTGAESVTFTPAGNHNGPFTIQSAQTQTLQQFYGSVITQVGIDTQTANTGTATQTNLATTIDAQRQSIDGINLDEETQNLIKYQNAYQAAAKTISTLNQLLNTIITGLGVGG
ncbi:MAG: flagellar hook-associated protein FlgK [Candidatus Eremiobacteraeota bacterium]|nr:flagellar hook-associated protein FlgK [Candidatus Eremiobacteraeota bacterium]